jgi:hypothetical protein
MNSNFLNPKKEVKMVRFGGLLIAPQSIGYVNLDPKRIEIYFLGSLKPLVIVYTIKNQGYFAWSNDVTNEDFTKCVDQETFDKITQYFNDSSTNALDK